MPNLSFTTTTTLRNEIAVHKHIHGFTSQRIQLHNRTLSKLQNVLDRHFGTPQLTDSWTGISSTMLMSLTGASEPVPCSKRLGCLSIEQHRRYRLILTILFQQTPGPISHSVVDRFVGLSS